MTQTASQTPALEPPPAARGAGPGRPRRSRPGVSLHTAERFGLFVLFAIVIVVFTILQGDTFATTANWRNIATSQSVLAVIGLALIFPLVGGRFDVSVGNNMGLCAVLVAALMGNHHWALLPAIVATVAVGSLIGVANGVIVTYLGVNSIIATIGTGTIMSGLVQAYTKGIPINNGLSPTLTTLSAKNVLGIPDLFVIMLIISVIAWFVLTQTPYGRRLLATGSNQSAARLTGMNVRRTILLSFVLSGCLAGVAGVLQIAAQGSGDPSAGGLPTILPALAAVFLGATTWQPGKYNVPGTIVGLFFVGTTISGLVLLGVEPWVTDVFNGAAVVVAIAISAQLRRRRTGTLEIGT
jgi:ribose transport system permease protein